MRLECGSDAVRMRLGCGSDVGWMWLGRVFGSDVDSLAEVKGTWFPVFNYTYTYTLNRFRLTIVM